MARILDFQCTYENNSGFGSWILDEPDIRFPQAYTDCEMMMSLALKVKAQNSATFCQLPFCHTLEAEALGGEIRLGDGVCGPRIGGHRCHSLEEILELPELDIRGKQSTRLRETVEACRRLRHAGEEVLFLTSGPITILNGLIDAETLFLAMLRQPELVKKVLWKLGKDILNVMKMAEMAGVRFISYADPAGSVGIVGPKIRARVVKDFTAEFLKIVDRELESGTMILLCPKTALALIGTEYAVWKEHELPEPMEYLEAVRSMNNMMEIRFAGQDCINHTGYKLENKIWKELVLK